MLNRNNIVILRMILFFIYVRLYSIFVIWSIVFNSVCLLILRGQEDEEEEEEEGETFEMNRSALISINVTVNVTVL